MNTLKDAAAVVARLHRLRFVDDNVLGAAICRAAACLEPGSAGTAPGWLHDAYTDPDVAARLCARCLVRDECTELELRLAGDRTVGLWGAYGESGRQALHRTWHAVRAADAVTDERAGTVPGREKGGR